MSINRLYAFTLSIISLTFFTQSVSANNPSYDQRREDYIDSSLNNTGGTKLILQAYRGLPLDTVELNSMLNSISTGETSDFDIIELIRILYLTNGTYDSKILPVLYAVPYWVNYGDLIRNYWSENHMIMWMGSDWLLHEKYNKPVDNRLEARLRHYLQLKVQFGFYEFFSSVYGPYELSGLLNLADFAQDAQIKDLATKASQQLLKDFLVLTNDQGTYFPVAGRNYPSKYESAYDQNHNNLIYLMTGFGEAPNGASHGGPFLASSTIPMDTVLSSWKPFENFTMHNGHSLDTGFIINAAMSPTDKTVFQWSSGAYFHPDVVQETAQLLTDSNIWAQTDFSILAPLSSIPPQNMPAVANTLSSISKSSVLCKADIAIYKHNSITLSSVLDFWKGKVGFQQYTCVANVGTTAVYTASGEVKANWNNRNANNQNVHLPYVEQHSNVSLIMYRPENVPTALGATYNYKEVALHFKDADFDEVVEDSLWLLGRQKESYVAVRRACIGEINTVRACPTTGGQTWVIMVGDSSMYGSFGNFQDVVHQSQFEEKWYLDTLSSQYVYYAKIVVDTATIDYAWGVDSTTSTGFTETETETADWNLFPNPTNDMIQLNTANPMGLGLVEIFNVTGQMVYNHVTGSQTLSISTLTFSEGSYFLRLTQNTGAISHKRLVITR